ncbi:MAG TPA: PIN domain-containing protein [Verrucomicrobiae bacterium]|jgi:predicted nucleic acid-binding protein|nr:PIN domain-containing protein [Verrucomicrobiae bacterium]
MKPVVMLADANVFLRFLRNDHLEHSLAAKQVMEQAAIGEVLLRVPEIVIADIFYTLTAPVMKIPRAAAARQLSALLQQPGIEVENRSRILDVLTICENSNIDYGDAALIVAARTAMQPILSYDHDLAKEATVTAFSPVDWLQKGRKLLK